jgi:hypothetical protein
MMRYAKLAVAKSRSHRNDFYVCIVITSIITDLLETSQCGEISDRIDEDDLPGESQTSGDTNHVLFGDPYVEKLLWMAFSKGIEHLEAKVGCDEEYVPIR